MQQYNIIVKGKVQGVWFRKYTAEKAIQLELNGYVMNKNNGTVYIEAVGTTKQLDSFVTWLVNEGSPLSRVADVVVNNQKTIQKGYLDFRIKK